LYYFVRGTTRRRKSKEENTGRKKKRNLFATTDTTLPAFESRAEIAPEYQDSAESRVEFAPAAKGGKSLKEQLS